MDLLVEKEGLATTAWELHESKVSEAWPPVKLKMAIISIEIRVITLVGWLKKQGTGPFAPAYDSLKGAAL